MSLTPNTVINFHEFHLQNVHQCLIFSVSAVLISHALKQQFNTCLLGPRSYLKTTIQSLLYLVAKVSINSKSGIPISCLNPILVWCKPKCINMDLQVFHDQGPISVRFQIIFVWLKRHISYAPAYLFTLGKLLYSQEIFSPHTHRLLLDIQ